MEEKINDSEAIMLVQEKDELAKDALFNKYSYIIDILLKKYDRIIKKLFIDEKEIYSEALYGFSDALNSYDEQKEASLPTFITICVERRIQNFIRTANSNKNKFNAETFSLDYVYDEYGFSLINILSDNKKDPLEAMTDDEKTYELYTEIKSKLSAFETLVFKYMLQGLNYIDIAKILEKEPKQIDNTMQRIKNKVKSIINA